MTTLLQSLEELQDWEGYRAFLKVQLKLLADGDPVYVSKDKVDFQIKGKPYAAHAVIVGQKGAQSAQKLRKEGLIFREGVCKLEDKTLFLEGIPDKVVRGASKTLKKLLLGYQIHADEEQAEDDDEAEAAPLAAGVEEVGADELARQPVRRPALDKTPEVWNATQRIVKSRIDQLKSAVRKAFAAESPDVVKEIEGSVRKLDAVFARLDDDLSDLLARAAASDGAARSAALQSAKKLLADHIQYVKSEPMIAHIDSNPFGIATDLQGTLTKSLRHLVQAVGGERG